MIIDEKKLAEVNDLAEAIITSCNAASITIIKTANVPANLGITPVLALALQLNKLIEWTEYEHL